MRSDTVTTSDGHRIQWHDTSRSLLDAALEAIQQGQKSVLLEQYIFRASPVAERFRDALADAARRGVEVCLLLDYMGCLALPRSYFAGLSAHGGNVVWFNPVRWTLWSFRDHRKLLIVDDTRAFIGGANIAPEYEGDGVTHGWRDGGIEVNGPVVDLLTHSFHAQLQRSEGRFWQGRHIGRSNWVKAGDDISLLLTRPGLRRDMFQHALRMDLMCAQDVAITMAYFLPMGGVKRALLRAARLARRFRMILAGKSDVPLMLSATRALYGRFQRRGAQVFEYAPQILHAKIIVIDDIVYIGSSNLDPRSLGINFEVMLRIHSEALARQALRTFERDLVHCRPIPRQSRRNIETWWQRLKQKLARLLFTRLDLGVAHFFIRKAEERGETDTAPATLNASPQPDG